MTETIRARNQQGLHLFDGQHGAVPEMRVPANADPGVVLQAFQRIYRAGGFQHDVSRGAITSVVSFKCADIAHRGVANVVCSDN